MVPTNLPGIAHRPSMYTNDDRRGAVLGLLEPKPRQANGRRYQVLLYLGQGEVDGELITRYAQLYAGASSRCVVANLEPGSLYGICVRSFNDEGVAGEASPVIFVRTPLPAPPVPSIRKNGTFVPGKFGGTKGPFIVMKMPRLDSLRLPMHCARPGTNGAAEDWGTVFSAWTNGNKQIGDMLSHSQTEVSQLRKEPVSWCRVIEVGMECCTVLHSIAVLACKAQNARNSRDHCRAH